MRVLGILAVIAVTVLFIVGKYVVSDPTIPGKPARWDDVRVGMTHEQVRTIIGPPNYSIRGTVAYSSATHIEWNYGKPRDGIDGNSGSCYVFFYDRPDGRVYHKDC